MLFDWITMETVANDEKMEEPVEDEKMHDDLFLNGKKVTDDIIMDLIEGIPSLLLSSNSNVRKI